jgi:hypothetical protein
MKRGKKMNFITVTEIEMDYRGETRPLPGLRLQTRHIIGYRPWPNALAGAKVYMADSEHYAVKETVEELDRLVMEGRETRE